MILFLMLLLLLITVAGIIFLIKPPVNTTRTHILKVVLLYDAVILATIVAANAAYNIFGEAWGVEGRFFAAIVMPLIFLTIIKTNDKYHWLGKLFGKFSVRVFVASTIAWVALMQSLNAIFSLDYYLGDQEFINLNYLPPLFALMICGLFKWVRGALPAMNKKIGDGADNPPPATSPLAQAAQELGANLATAGVTVTKAQPPADGARLKATFVTARQKPHT